ncbi:MAG: AAA family ATPase [Planctomycetes bacterium]|nr:AAA family ATPase [Planctomycetota bacterium]
MRCWLGIGVSFALPYNAKAKRIERLFATINSQFTATFNTYCGQDVIRRPEDMAAVLNDPNVIESALSLEDFARLFGEYAKVYNNTAHTGEGMDGMSPAEVMAARTSERMLSKGVLDMALSVWSRELKVGKNGVRFKKQLYGQYNMELFLHYGKTVKVSYNPDDLSRITVYDARTMKRICIAEENKLLAYGQRVSEEDVREAQRQKNKALKVVRAYRDATLTANTDLVDLSLKAAQDKQKPTPKPGAKPRIVRPVKTVFDDQVEEHQRDVARRKLKKAVGAESVQEPLDINVSLLREIPAKYDSIQLFGKGYKGNVRKLINKIVHLMDSVDRKARDGKHRPFVQTAVARLIGTLITQTEAFSVDEGRIGLIIGDGGHGKSLCMRQYARANQNTIYIELDDTMSSTGLFAEIAKALRINSTGRPGTVTRRIIDALRCRNVIVMLDEASGLTVKQLNQLRQVIVVKLRCPLVLAGNADLLTTVIQRTTKRGHESLDQFTSRLMAVLNLNELAADKDGPLYTADDIRKLYEYGGISLTSDAVSTLKSICKTPKSGRLRTCSHIIAALHTAKVVNEKGYIDAAMVLSAVEQLQLPTKAWLPLVIADDAVETCVAGHGVARVG